MLIRGFSFEVKQCPTVKYLWHFSSVLCSRNSLDCIRFHHLKRFAAVVLLALVVENVFSALHPSKFPTCCMNWDLFKYPQLLGFHGKEEIKQGKFYFVCLQKTINSYWARLRKISWFFSFSLINYLPKAEANRWSSRQWQMTIFWDNRVQ